MAGAIERGERLDDKRGGEEGGGKKKREQTPNRLQEQTTKQNVCTQQMTSRSHSLTHSLTHTLSLPFTHSITHSIAHSHSHTHARACARVIARHHHCRCERTVVNGCKALILQKTAVKLKANDGVDNCTIDKQVAPKGEKEKVGQVRRLSQVGTNGCKRVAGARARVCVCVCVRVHVCMCVCVRVCVCVCVQTGLASLFRCAKRTDQEEEEHGNVGKRGDGEQNRIQHNL